MGLDLRRVAASALEAALAGDATTPPPPRKHHPGARAVVTVAALGAAAGVAWKTVRPRLPDLSELGDRARDQLAHFGLLDGELGDVEGHLDDEPDDDEDVAYDEDEDDEAYDEYEEVPDAKEALEHQD